MVALHNKKLSYRDVFRGNLWSWDSVNDKKREFEKARLDAGQSGLEAMMGAATDLQEYLAAQPSMKDRQRVFARIYPPVATPSPVDKLRLALEAIRDGHNDPRRLATEVLAEVFD